MRTLQEMFIEREKVFPQWNLMWIFGEVTNNELIIRNQIQVEALGMKNCQL